MAIRKPYKSHVHMHMDLAMKSDGWIDWVHQFPCVMNLAIISLLKWAQLWRMTSGKGFNKVGLANLKVARQLGRVAMKSRSRVHLKSIIIDRSNTVGSSTQPCGPATRNTWT
jgi:hypothetical protein